MNVIIYLMIGALFLFVLIAYAVKFAIKEAYYELKDDFIKELSAVNRN